MLWQQVVELHSGGPDGKRGSGYQIASGLVLTAGHVVAGRDETRLRLLLADEDGLPGELGPWQDARVAWTDGKVDLALLVPKEGDQFGVGKRSTIGRLDGRAPIRVDSLGFPRAMQDARRSDTLHIEAVVNPWTGVRSESLVLSVQTARPGDGDEWRGMSGAALFAGDRLVGVVKQVPGRFDSNTLNAAPAHALFEYAGAAQILQAARVSLAERTVDASYVESLPRIGHWGGVRERYTRAVVTNLCRVDHVGLAVGGAPDSRKPALAVFSGWRLRPKVNFAKLTGNLVRTKLPSGFL